MQSYACAPLGDDVCPTCPYGGGPIALSTGNTYIDEIDVRVPGLSRGLSLNRVWNSRSAYSQGMFGNGWRSSFEEKVFVGNQNYIDYWKSDDSIWSFGYVGGDPAGSGDALYWIAAPSNAGATLQWTKRDDPAQSFWTLTLKDGEKRIYNEEKKYLVSISDRNGNATTLTHDSLDRVSMVADPGGRHLYFNYGPSGNLVQTVTTDFGISLTYTYDAQHRLTQVTYPDNTFKTFEYDANSFITAVKDSQGKILESHTYNTCGQGLTSSRSGGVEAITVAYPLTCGLELP